jgi:hypothetical protein
VSAALATSAAPGSRQVLIEGSAADLEGILAWPEHPSGTTIVLGDASREGGEPALVARRLREAGLATLSVVLPEQAGRKPGLAQQLLALAHWVARQRETEHLPVGVYAPEGAMAVAIGAATLEPESIDAIVVRGGIPRGAHTTLPGLHAATLFLVESDDPRDALRTMAALSGLHGDTLVVDLRRARGSGTISHAELVADWSAEWLVEHLALERTWRGRALR